MAHFVKVLDGRVVDGMVAEPEFMENYIDSTPGRWIQTSYNTSGGVHYDENGEPSADQTKALRKNYASEGMLYNVNDDAFYHPQPYPSWTLNTETYIWECPVEVPTEGGPFTWNEETQSWDADE